MSHTPSTENGATRLQSNFDKEFMRLRALLKFANDAYALSTDDIEDDDEEEEDVMDGVMRFVE